MISWLISGALATLDVLCWIMSVIRSWCRCHLVLVVSWIGFSIRVRIWSLIQLFVPFHLYVQFDVAHNHFVVTSSVDWYVWWCLASLLGCSKVWSSLHRLGIYTSISSLLSSGTWYSWFCTLLLLPILPWCHLFRFSIQAHAHWNLPSLSCTHVVVWFP